MILLCSIQPTNVAPIDKNDDITIYNPEELASTP